MQKALFKSSKRKHFFSYVGISVLPVLICIALLSANNLSAYKTQQDSSVLYGMRQFTNNYHIYMEIMDACIEHFDEKLHEGLPKTSIPAQLASYENNYPQITAVYYFEKTSNCIFTSGGEMKYADFERQMQANLGINLTKMAFYLNICQATVDNTLVSARQDVGESNQYLFYIKVLPRLDPSPKYVMIFMLPIQSVIGRLNEYVPDGYSVYSYSDQFLTYLVQEGDGYRTDALQTQLNKLYSDNLTHERISGEPYVLLRVKSGIDGMYHMIAYRESVLYHSAYQSAIRALLPMALILAVTVAMAFFLHRYFYSGIERILMIPFPEKNAFQFNNPYTYIETQTRYMLNQNQQMLSDISRYNTLSLLKGLLYGTIENDQPINESLFGADLHSVMPYPWFTAAYVRNAALPRTCNANYLSADFPQISCSVWLLPVCGGSAVAILINSVLQDAATLVQLCGSYLNAQEIRYEAIGIGTSQSIADRVQVSLMQAQIASHTHAGINLYAMGEENVRMENLMPIAEQRRICQGILSGNGTDAVAAYHSLMEKLRNVTLSSTISREWYLFIMESIVETLRENMKSESDIGWNLETMMQIYAEKDDARFCEIIRNLADKVVDDREKKLSANQNAMIAYIQEHILDIDMSPEQLAKMFNISETAVLNVIRESTGMTFTKYVNQLRMEYVCRQLRETDRPIRDIIAEVGYQDASNFTRKFRLQFGCTPSAYRDSASSDYNIERI